MRRNTNRRSREREKGTEKGPALGSGRILRKGEEKKKGGKRNRQPPASIFVVRRHILTSSERRNICNKVANADADEPPQKTAEIM